MNAPSSDASSGKEHESHVAHARRGCRNDAPCAIAINVIEFQGVERIVSKTSTGTLWSYETSTN